MYRRPFSARLTVAAAAVLTAWNVHADQASASVAAEPPVQQGKSAAAGQAEPAPTMERVEIKGTAAAYDPRRDDTASKIIVTNEEILRYGDTSVTDVFKRLPGITVGGAAGRGGGDIRMRGLGSGYTQILLNGERAPAGFSIDSLSPDVIERIEILRAASAEFSTQSIAGTINIVLKRAIKTAQRELKLSYGKGTDFSSPSTSLQLSDRDGGFSYSLSGTLFRYNHDRETFNLETGEDAAGRSNLLRRSAQHDTGRSEGGNMSPRLNWTLKNGDTLTSQTFFSYNHFDFRGRTPVVTSLGRAPEFEQINNGIEGDNAFGRTDLNWVRKLAGGAKLDLKLGVNGSRNVSEAHQAGSNRNVLQLDRTVASKSVETGYSTTGKYSTPLITDHALAMGWDGGYNQRDDERLQREAPLPDRLPDNSDEGFDATVSRLALFAQDEWNLTPRISVYAGLRWEGLDTKSEGNTFDPISNRSSVWSPLFQTLWKLPNSKDQFRFAVTRTYKAVPTASLIPRRFTSTNNTPTEPDRRGNPNLKPELALGFDASYEHYWAEGALLSASASMRRIDGYTRQALLFENERWVQTSVNDGRAVTRGIELEAKFPLLAVMADAPALDLRASISRNWSRVEAVPGPNNRLDQQVPLSATLGADYKVPGGALTMGGSYAFKNGGLVRVSERQASYLSVRRDLDVYALYKFNPRYQLRAALSNLLAEDYQSETVVTGNSGTIRRQTVYPGATQVRATLEMKF